MTKTGHVLTITKLDHDPITSCSMKQSTGSVSIVDKDLDNQRGEILQEDLINNNDIVKSDKILLDECEINNNSKINNKNNNVNVNYKNTTGSDILDDKTVITKPIKVKILGFEFDSPLKWDNITGIVIIHSLFVYSLICRRPMPQYYQTYLWGNVLTIIFLLFFIFH